MKHNIENDKWHEVAAYCKVFWSDLTDEEVVRARESESSLRNVLKAKYHFNGSEVDEQVDAFLKGYTLGTLEVRPSPPI